MIGLSGDLNINRPKIGPAPYPAAPFLRPMPARPQFFARNSTPADSRAATIYARLPTMPAGWRSLLGPVALFFQLFI